MLTFDRILTVLQGIFRPTFGAEPILLSPNLCSQGAMISASGATRTDCNKLS